MIPTKESLFGLGFVAVDGCPRRDPAGDVPRPHVRSLQGFRYSEIHLPRSGTRLVRRTSSRDLTPVVVGFFELALGVTMVHGGRLQRGRRISVAVDDGIMNRWIQRIQNTLRQRTYVGTAHPRALDAGEIPLVHDAHAAKSAGEE